MEIPPHGGLTWIETPIFFSYTTIFNKKLIQYNLESGRFRKARWFSGHITFNCFMSIVLRSIHITEIWVCICHTSLPLKYINSQVNHNHIYTGRVDGRDGAQSVFIFQIKVS